jgi:hypothetical protein
LIHFWWWEFRLQAILQWTFPLYFFIAMHAVLLFLLCVLLFPDEMAEYDGFKTYFYSRREWIFSLMTILFLADIADAAIKGASYVHALGVFYYVRTSAYILLSAAAIKIKAERFHACFAIFAVVCEVALILKYYMIMTGTSCWRRRRRPNPPPSAPHFSYNHERNGGPFTARFTSVARGGYH